MRQAEEWPPGDDPTFEDVRPYFDALRHQRVLLDLPAWDLWLICSNLQLALRHPGNTRRSAREVRKVVELIFSKIAPSGPLKRLADMGWQQEFDVPVERGSEGK